MTTNSKNLSNEKNTNPKKLLVIGNGFDLHLNLASSFDNFFDNDDVKLHSNLNKKENDSEKEKEGLRSSIPFAIEKLNTNNNEVFSNANHFISFYTEYNMDYIYVEPFHNFYKPVINQNDNANFWALYFTYLKYFPNFTDGNDIFEIDKSNIEKDNFPNLKNWSDVEYQIQYLLTHSEDTLNKYSNCIKNDNSFTTKDNLKAYAYDYENSMMKNGKITFNGAISFLAIRCALETGWRPKRINIYDYIYAQLQEFEGIFETYLKKELDNAKDNNNYTSLSNLFANRLTGNQQYNLLNFNYTTFYNVSDPNKTNIHSTLEEGGHPIFGISSDLGNNELIYQKPYYRFSKAYRIMKLTNDNSIKNILPKNIDEIIFYGQSLSQADYLYFDTIFTEYDIYNSNIKITFKYSTDFGDKNKIEQHQIFIVYKLINQFSEHINVSNLLPKLLLENRLKIEELKNRVSN